MGYPMQNDGEHIWLRQSVTLTVQGQTRTIEMAVPVRPGATADEVEALLSEADAGMQRLSRHLDEQVARLTGAAPAAQPAPNAAMPPAPQTTKQAVKESAASPAAATVATTPAPSPSTTRPETPQREQPQPPTRPATPAAAHTTPATPPSRAAASGPLTKPAAPPAPSTPSVPLSVKDFIAAAQTELNLTPKQAMEQLGVKSLSGLNLREALEMLRRQSLRTGGPSASTSAPASAPAARTSPAKAQSTTPARYFEEEDDDLDVSFSVEGEDDLEDEFAAPDPDAARGAAYAGFDGDEEDVFDLEDVPDFGAPPVTPTAPVAPSGRSAARRPAPATPRMEEPEDSEEIAEIEEIEMPPSQPVGSDMRARALQIIGHLRGVASGGSSTTQQRAAYRNIVVGELGEPEAKALVQGIWRTSADRLGAEQLDTLLSWGKRETFREDAATVLAVLRAERERATQAAATEPPNAQAGRNAPKQATSRTTSPGGTTPRSRSSARPAGGQ